MATSKPLDLLFTCKTTILQQIKTINYASNIWCGPGFELMTSQSKVSYNNHYVDQNSYIDKGYQTRALDQF